MIINLIEKVRGVLVQHYPHLADGALEEFLKAYFTWIGQTILAIAGTLVFLAIILAIFNNTLNIATGNKGAARKFWTKLYNKI